MDQCMASCCQYARLNTFVPTRSPFFGNVSHRNLAAIVRYPSHPYSLSLLALDLGALLPEYHSFPLHVVWAARLMHINTVQH